MFKLWNGQRNLQSPFSSVWQYDLGKLLVPNVFMDIDLLKAIANRYDPISRVISGDEGEIMLTIKREEFQEIFDLYEPSANLVQVCLNELKAEYYKIKGFITTYFLPIHLEKVGQTTYYIGPSSEETFTIGAFSPYFQATFFSMSGLGVQTNYSQAT